MEIHGSAMQRAAALIHLPPLLDEFGVGLERVLAETGIAADDLAPERFIPYRAVLAILENAARLTGLDDLGLRLGLRQSLAALGPLGQVMRHASTLGEALADFAAFQITNCTGAAVYLHRAGDEVICGYGIYDISDTVSPQVHDTVLAVGRNLVAELTGGTVVPTEFVSMRPAPADATPWRALGAPIRFGQDQTGLFLPRYAVAFPLPTANPAVRDAALSGVAPQLVLAPWGWAGRTRHAMRSLLLEGRSKMPHVARHLGLHPRSLRRALDQEGTRFEVIKDEVRQAVARELLTLTALPVGELALTLDFASPSAFIHAFNRWTGTSPAAWRMSRAMHRLDGRRAS